MGKPCNIILEDDGNDENVSIRDEDDELDAARRGLIVVVFIPLPTAAPAPTDLALPLLLLVASTAAADAAACRLRWSAAAMIPPE